MSYETLYTGFVFALLIITIIAMIMGIKHFLVVAKWAFAGVIENLSEPYDYNIDEMFESYGIDSELSDDVRDEEIDDILFRPGA